MLEEPEGQNIQKDSVLNPKRIAQLFLKPKQFFQDLPKLDTQYIHFATLIVEILMIMDRIDQQLLKISLNENPDFSRYAFVVERWSNYWIFVFVLGLFASVIVWFVYGWFYKIRLTWSGVDNPDSTLVRQVNVLQWCIFAIPIFIITLLQTFIYENYLAAFLSDEIWTGILIMAMSLYSSWVSYVAVKTIFSVNKWGIFWFLLLPLVSYILIVIIYIMRAL